MRTCEDVDVCCSLARLTMMGVGSSSGMLTILTVHWPGATE